MKFANFLWYTYDLEPPLYRAYVASKVKIVEKFIIFPNEVKNFANKAKFLTPSNI